MAGLVKCNPMSTQEIVDYFDSVSGAIEDMLNNRMKTKQELLDVRSARRSVFSRVCEVRALAACGNEGALSCAERPQAACAHACSD